MPGASTLSTRIPGRHTLCTKSYKSPPFLSVVVNGADWVSQSPAMAPRPPLVGVPEVKGVRTSWRLVQKLPATSPLAAAPALPGSTEYGDQESTTLDPLSDVVPEVTDSSGPTSTVELAESSQPAQGAQVQEPVEVALPADPEPDEVTLSADPGHAKVALPPDLEPTDVDFAVQFRHKSNEVVVDSREQPLW